MIKHPNKILHIGRGCNIESVIHFSQTKEFVFIDSQPRIKCEKIYLEPTFNKKEYISDFVNNLLLTCLFHGFELESKTIIDKKYHKKIIPKKWFYFSCLKKMPKNIDPTLLVFTNKKTEQIIHYYISTNIKYNIYPGLRYDISTSNAIIVSEYFPDTQILDYFGTSKIFIGYSNINYHNNNNNNNNNVLYFLHNPKCNIHHFFSEFYIIDKNNVNISKYKDFNDLLLENVI